MQVIETHRENYDAAGMLCRGHASAQKGPSLAENKQEHMLRQDGDVVGYYAYRLGRGDWYASTALDIVTNRGILGPVANLHLAGSAFLNGVDYDQSDVNLRLMHAHGNAVNSDSRGIPGLLSHDQITSYHHQVFSDLGLPTSTFGGTPVTGLLGESGWWDSAWCSRCDTQ